MELTPIAIDFHRNGIAGTPFSVVLFHDGQSRKVAIAFERPGYCAVLDVTKLAAGDIAFGSNSWRGDEFEPDLRRVIDEDSDPSEST